MSQDSKLFDCIFGKREPRFVCGDIKGEYTAVGAIVLQNGQSRILRSPFLLLTRFVPLLSVHIDWSRSTLSPMVAGKFELFEIADCTANFRKSMKFCSPDLLKLHKLVGVAIMLQP
jgi:hypothetical protein